jgi:hypothetical protein
MAVEEMALTQVVSLHSNNGIFQSIAVDSNDAKEKEIVTFAIRNLCELTLLRGGDGVAVEPTEVALRAALLFIGFISEAHESHRFTREPPAEKRFGRIRSTRRPWPLTQGPLRIIEGAAYWPVGYQRVLRHQGVIKAARQLKGDRRLRSHRLPDRSGRGMQGANFAIPPPAGCAGNGLALCGRAVRRGPGQDERGASIGSIDHEAAECPALTPATKPSPSSTTLAPPLTGRTTRRQRRIERETGENMHEFIFPLALTCSCCLQRVPGNAEFCPYYLDTKLSTKSPRELEAPGEDPMPNLGELE